MGDRPAKRGAEEPTTMAERGNFTADDPIGVKGLNSPHMSRNRAEQLRKK